MRRTTATRTLLVRIGRTRPPHVQMETTAMSTLIGRVTKAVRRIVAETPGVSYATRMMIRSSSVLSNTTVLRVVTERIGRHTQFLRTTTGVRPEIGLTSNERPIEKVEQIRKTNTRAETLKITE